MRMRELGRSSPLTELSLGRSLIRGNEFYGRFFGLRRAELGEVHCTVFRATQILPQEKLAINNLAFPLFPGLGHRAHSACLICWVKIIVGEYSPLLASKIIFLV